MVIRVTDLHAHGVRLISPTHPEFDAIARPLIGERVADRVLALKPMLVIVSNDSAHTIASLSIVWTTHYDDGHTHTSWTHASSPPAITGLDANDRTDYSIAPGTRRIEGNGIVVHGYGHNDPFYDQFIDQFDPRTRHELDGAREFHIELNAVIFIDGTAIGPDDQSQLRDLFSRYVSAQRTWLTGIRQALDAGDTVVEAFEAVERFQREVSESRGRMLSHREDPDHVWRIQTSGDVLRWRDRHKQSDIAALVKTLNLEPFVIRPI